MKVIYFLLLYLFFNSVSGLTPNGEIYANVVRCMSGIDYNHKELVNEIISWKNKQFTDSIKEMTSLKEIDYSFFKGKHVSLAKVFVLKKGNSYETKELPSLFLSGLDSAFKKSSKNPFSKYISFIDTFKFKTTSDQVFAHSERAVVLAVREKVLKTLPVKEVKDILILIKNQKRMCENCEQFFRGIGVYFVSVDEGGCFVGKEYKTKYDESYSMSDKLDFISEYSKYLGLTEDISPKKEPMNDAQISAIWEKIVPRTIQELIPSKSTVIESMDDGIVSEFVKIQIP